MRAFLALRLNIVFILLITAHFSGAENPHPKEGSKIKIAPPRKWFKRLEGDDAVANDILKKYFNSGTFAVSGISSTTDGAGDKKLTGSISFFGNAGVNFECLLSSDNKPKSIIAKFPANAALRISHLDRLTQGELRSLLPAKFSTDVGISIKDFSMTFANGELETFEGNLAAAEWDFLDFDDFKLKSIDLKVTAKPAQNSLGLVLNGQVSIGNTNIQLIASIAKGTPFTISGSLGAGQSVTVKDAIYSLAGNEEAIKFFGLIPGEAFNAITLPQLKFTGTPSEKKAGLSAISDQGNIELNFIKKGSRKEIRMVSYPKDLSSVLPIDLFSMIHLKDPVLVVSSMKSHDASITTIDNQTATVDLDEGVNVISNILLPDEIKSIFKIEKINLRGSIDNRKQVTLEGKEKLDLPLGDSGVKLSDIDFGVKSNPAPMLFLDGTLLIPVNGQTNLIFTAGLSTAPAPPQLGGRLDLLVEGGGDIWKEPFGIPGVGIQKLGGEVMLMPAPPFLAQLSLRGGLLIGKDLSDGGNAIRGELDMKLNVTNPLDSYLEASIDNLTITNMVNAFSSAQLSGELANLLNTGIKHGKVIINPKASEVAISGDISLFGLGAQMAFSASKTGISASGSIDPWEIKSGDFTIFSIKGAGGNERPGFAMAFDADPYFMFNGTATALGAMTASANVVIRKEGFIVDLEGKIFGGVLDGKLHAQGTGLGTASPSIMANLTLSQNVINNFEESLNNFIKDQAKNSEETIRKARDQVNSGSGEVDAAVKGFLDGVNELQKGTATAGMMLVKGLIPDVRSITFAGELSPQSTRMMMNIDLYLGGQHMPLAMEMDLTNAEQEIKRIAEEIGKQILNSMAYLGDEVVSIANQAKEFFVDLGKGFEQLGAEISVAAQDAVNEIDRFWNGESFEPVQSAGPLGQTGINTRHYMVTIRQVVALSTEDDPIPGKVTEGIGSAVDAVGNFFTGGNSNATQQAMTVVDPDVEIYGAIIVASDNSMRVSPGTNANAWSTNRVYAIQNVHNGSSFSINNTKHFYAENGQNPSITIRSKLKEYDEGEVYTSDGEFSGIITVGNLGNWNWTSGGRVDDSFNATTVDGGKTSVLRVDYAIELEPKISAQQIRQYVANRDRAGVEQLAMRGGDLREAGIIEPAIANRDLNMVNYLVASNATITAQDVATALNPQYFNAEIGNRILINYRGAFNKENLRNGIETGSLDVVSTLIGRGAAPDMSHVNQALAKGQYGMADMLLGRGVPVGAAELGQAVSAQNFAAAGLFMKYKAQPDINMLNQSIQSGNKDLVRLLLSAQKPDQVSYQLASDKNDLELFSWIGNQGIPLTTDGPSQRALDLNNLDLLKLCFKYGANPTAAMNYAMQRDNLPAVGLCLTTGADANQVLPYAAKKNNMDLFKTVITQFDGNPTAALSEAISANNIEMAKVALQTGNANPSTRLDELANAGNEPMVRLLIDAGGNPALAMTGTIALQKPDLLSYLIQSGAEAEGPAYIQSAVNLGSLPMTTILVKAGANPDNGMAAAMTKNDFAIASFLLNQGASPNGFLAAPAGRGDLNMIKLLLDHGAAANEGIGPAIQGNQAAAAKMFLEFGASPAGQLAGPSQSGNTEMVKLLLDFGANSNEGILPAVKADKTEAAKLLLEAGASPGGLMSTAAGFGNKVIVEMLLDRNIDPNEGIRPAVEGNFTDVALLLLDHHASITGLIVIASGKGNAPLVERLLKEGAVADEGIVPAVTNKFVEVTKMLIGAGAKVESSSFMLIAVNNKQVEMVNLLHDNKCDVSYVDAKGNTFLHIVAADDGQVALAQAFLNFGLNLGAVNNDGNTPLHVGAESGKDNLDVVKLLVEAGADVNAVNKKGETPRKAANGHKVKKYLKDQGGERKIKK